MIYIILAICCWVCMLLTISIESRFNSKNISCSFGISVCVGLMVFLLFRMGNICLDDKKEPTQIEINKPDNEKKLQAFEWKISGLNDEIRELRAITDEFRAQIKGLQKEVLIGIQEGGM